MSAIAAAAGNPLVQALAFQGIQYILEIVEQNTKGEMTEEEAIKSMMGDWNRNSRMTRAVHDALKAKYNLPD